MVSGETPAFLRSLLSSFGVSAPNDEARGPDFRILHRLGVERAHIVGHSSSAVIALQLALAFPDAVLTLALMEPARPVPPTEEQAQFVRGFVAPAVQRYRAGDNAGAVDTFARGGLRIGLPWPAGAGTPGGL